MNPCPCGYLGDTRGRCRCLEERVARYQSRISDPLLDRIDLHVEIPAVKSAALGERAPAGEALQNSSNPWLPATAPSTVSADNSSRT